MIEIDDRAVGSGHRPYIIAEVGINARNDLPLAKRLIDAAAEAGADAVKFQTHLADAEMVESEMERIDAGDVYDTVAGCEWSVTAHRELQSHADARGITFLSTPFSTDAVDILADIDVPAIKIGSGEMNNRELLQSAAETGKPLLISTGMNTLADVKATTEFLDGIETEYALFYCVSEYPATSEDFDFQTISALKEIAGVPVGFSDHSSGIDAAKVAIGNGADIIETHFTIDRRLPGPDQAVSIEPAQLTDLCDYATLFHETSSKRDGLHSEETEIKKWAQHSIVSTRTIEAGDPLTEENTTTKRPGTGVSAEQYFDVLGDTAATEIPPNTVVHSRHLSE